MSAARRTSNAKDWFVAPVSRRIHLQSGILFDLLETGAPAPPDEVEAGEVQARGCKVDGGVRWKTNQFAVNAKNTPHG